MRCACEASASKDGERFWREPGRATKYHLNETPSTLTNYLVKTRPAARFLAGTLSLLLATAWLVASNHCAIAGFAPRPAAIAAGHEHCPAQKAPEKRPGGCDGHNCCKSLSAPTVALTKSLSISNQFQFVPVDFRAISPALFGGMHESLLCELDTGPPVGGSFAESVLQRSLLAHAPPFCV